MTRLATIEVGAAPLRPGDVEAIARHGAGVALTEAALARVAAGHAALEAAVARGEAIYGVSTGLGAAVDTRVDAGEQARQLRIALGRSVGAGPLVPTEIVRAAMAVRLTGLAMGRSGASPGIVQALAGLLNARVHPTVRSIGSVGEADLAPLAHIASVLMGAGEAEYEGRVLAGADALAQAGLAVPRPGVKDGLALVSCNAASVGHGALVVQDGARVLEAWYGAAALSCAGFGANLSPLDPRAADLRAAPGQAQAARRLLALLEGTEGLGRRLQDPLSLRCLAPVMGAGDAALARAREAVELELDSAGDSPAILAEEGDVLGTANFDATHLALAFEGLGLALARMAALAGARLIQLMSPAASALPRFLSPAGVGQSGFAPLQKTIAALVAHVQHLATPMPTVVLPAAEGIEDYSTMAPSVVAKTAAAVEQVRILVAIEFIVAAQACDLRGAVLGPHVAALHAVVRGVVAPLAEDRGLGVDVERLLKEALLFCKKEAKNFYTLG